MRKRYRVLLLAAIVAAVVVPVGFALSLESAPSAVHVPTATVVAAAPSAVAMPTLVHAESPTDLPRPVPDGAKLLVVGTMLFGLAAVVRRAA
jgi:ABC-type anion transport system duplicated permease subunit